MFEQLKKISLASEGSRSLVAILTGLPSYLKCCSLVSYCSNVCEKQRRNCTKARRICKQSRGFAKPIWQHCIQTILTGMWCKFCLCLGSPVLKPSVSAAVTYSDITVSILKHISYPN